MLFEHQTIEITLIVDSPTVPPWPAKAQAIAINFGLDFDWSQMVYEKKVTGMNRGFAKVTI